MARFVSLVLISIFSLISCGKPVPSDPDEKILVDILYSMQKDEDFFKFVTVGEYLFDKESAQYKAYDKKMSQFSSASHKVSQALKTDPQNALKILGEKYVNNFEELDKRLDQSYIDKQKYYDKIDSSRAKLKKIALACKDMLKDKEDAIIPSAEEIKKFIGDEDVFMCPCANKPFELIGAGEKFTGAKDKPLAQTLLVSGHNLIVYQNGRIGYKR